MAESEPKPKLIELVAPGAGQGWKAVLKNGKPAVIHEIPVPPAEATAAIPRIQRLAEHRHPALSPVLAWGTDPNGIWVAVEPNEGTPLATILSRGPLTPPAAAALGAAVLSGVAALHEAGIAMGGFAASAIRVNSNGEVRLAGHPAAAVRGAPSQSDLRADVRSSGMAVCAAFGVDPAGAPAPPNIPPGLVVTMRSMASGAMGPAADRAQNALREMASALLAPDRQIAAQSELATRAGGRESPGVTPFVPAGTVPPAARPAPAPYVQNPPRERDETPVRAPASYDAPARSVQTYPSIPAPTYGPTPPAPAPAPPAPKAPEPPKPAPIPTWDDPPAPPAAATNPPAPAPAPPAPAREWPVVPPVVPPAPAPFAPSGPRSPFDSGAPSAASTNPPAPAAPAPPAFTPPPSPPPAFMTPPSPPPAPTPPAPAKPAWTPQEAPAWKPAEPVNVETAAAAEWAGSSAIAPPRTPTLPPTPAPVAPAPLPAPRAPARKATVARKPAGFGGPSERPPWLIPAIIGIVLILLLGTIGGIVLAGRGSNPGVATKSPAPKTSPKASPKVTPTPSAGVGPFAVPNYGPAAEAPITKVIICSPATPCPIGAGIQPETGTTCDLNSCKIEVAIYFSAPQRSPVSYMVKFFDRCANTTKDLPGPNPYSPPGYVVVIPTNTNWPVAIPAGTKSGAIVVVTQQPSVATSPPWQLGPESCA